MAELSDPNFHLFELDFLKEDLVSLIGTSFPCVNQINDILMASFVLFLSFAPALLPSRQSVRFSAVMQDAVQKFKLEAKSD